MMIIPADKKVQRLLFGILGLFALLGIALALVVVPGKRSAKDGAPADSAAAFEDLDKDNQPDALPLRRIASQPGGDIVIAAIAASGGYAAWARHAAATFELESVIFDERGAIDESRVDRVTLKWAAPPRARIEAQNGSTVAALGAAGAWGAARNTGGIWEIGKGPGAWPAEMLRDHLRDAIWEFCLPYNLGDVDATLSLPAPVDSDSLDRVVVTYPPAVGEAAGRSYELGFSKDPGDLVEVKFSKDAEAGEGAEDAEADKEAGEEDASETAPQRYEYLLRIETYEQMGLLDRPLRRTLYRLDPDGNRGPVVHEQRISKFLWDPEDAGSFEDPPF